MAAPVLRARGLTRSIDGRTLWRDLDLDLADGENLALVGPSGSGKSFLLRTLVGLESLDAGSISWWGEDLDDAKMPQLRARVLLLRQEPAFGEGSAAEALERVAGFGVHSLDAEERRDRARELLRRLDPDGDRGDLLERDIDDLSGGERRMVALVRALQLDPDVLLADEPTAGMDRELAERVEELLAERTWIWVAHHEDQVEADRVVELDHGADESQGGGSNGS